MMEIPYQWNKNDPVRRLYSFPRKGIAVHCYREGEANAGYIRVRWDDGDIEIVSVSNLRNLRWNLS